MRTRYSFGQKLIMLLGFAPGNLMSTLKGIPFFLRTARQYRRLNRRASFNISFRSMFPVLTDRGDKAGIGDPAYFYQDLWAARKIFERKPKQHVDIGSRVDGFVAHVLTFMPVTLIDIRPLKSTLPGLSFINDNATELSTIPDGSVESLSTLSAAEHFGLGRYSDPVDPESCFRFMNALQRVLAPGGRLYFGVPVGIERVEFNAHRVFDPETILAAFNELQLVSFSYVGDDDEFHEDRPPAESGGCEFAFGLFEFTKR